MQYMVFIFPTLIIVTIIVFAFIVKKKEKQAVKLSECGPFSIAVVDKTEKKRRAGTDRVGAYYNRCYLTYLDSYGNEQKAILDLPYDCVPVGGEIKIAYNPENHEEVYFVEALYMHTPEYIERMEKLGYERIIEDGVTMFRKKNFSENTGLFKAKVKNSI